MIEEVVTGEHSEKTKKNKKLIPSDVSAVGYISLRMDLSELEK